MVIVESSITPKLRQESETPMTVSGITIELISILLKLTFEPNKTNSVFHCSVSESVNSSKRQHP